MPKGHFICSSRGREAESSSEESACEVPCEALSGQLIVSHWKGLGPVEHYNYCSLTCLER